MAYQYSRSDLKSAINRGIQNKQGLLIDFAETCNEAVRLVLNEVRIRSTRRKFALVPNLLAGENQYQAPTDLRGNFIIDIPAQATRSDGEFNLVPTEQFARVARMGDIAIDDYNGIRVLYIRSATQDQSATIDPLSQIQGSGGTWDAFGDADALVVNTDNYIKGNGSLEFSIDASAGVTAGIFKTDADNIDLSEFIQKNASFYSYALASSITGITAVTLRLGTDASNYFQYQVTVQNDGTALQTGWNALRFDALSPTVVGVPDENDILYEALFFNKETSKQNEGGYAFNYLVAKKGQYADVKYYGTNGWTSSDGVYKLKSTIDSDLLIAGEDEFDLFVKKGRVVAAMEADLAESTIRKREEEYTTSMMDYKMNNPSEEKVTISTYYDYGSRDTARDIQTD